MVLIKISGRREDADEIKSFKTYSNYLQSVKNFIISEYGDAPKCFESINCKLLAKDSFSKIQTNSNLDIEKLKKLLFNSWHTELVFNLPFSFDPSFTQYSNHWAPIQAYYSIFLSIRAFFISSNIICEKTHNTTLAKISNIIRERDLFMSPWNAYCKGLKQLKNVSYENISGEIKEISNLSTPRLEDFWSWYGMLLRTTRDRQHKGRREEILHRWKTRNGKRRKRLPKNRTDKIEKRMHATTFFDGMYRLRIRSNYEDADSFILGTMTSEEAETFYKSIYMILGTTLFIFENLIAKYIGKEKFVDILNDFVNSVPDDTINKTIKLRRDYF